MNTNEDILLRLDKDEAELHRAMYEGQIDLLKKQNEDDVKLMEEAKSRISARNGKIDKYRNLLLHVKEQLIEHGVIARVYSSNSLFESRPMPPKSIASKPLPPKQRTEYDKEWSLAKKAYFVLERAERLLTTRDII